MDGVPPGDFHLPQSPETVRATNQEIAQRIASAIGPGSGRLRRPGSSVGCVLVLAGIAAFAVGCFLPFYAFGATPSDETMSLWEASVTQRHSLLARIGGALTLFGGPVVLAALAVSAIRGSTSWSRPALLAAAAVWTLSWIGTISNDSPVFPGGHESGFWLIAVGVFSVALGALLVLVEAVRATREPASRADA